jgi:hypothetical protein
MPTLLWFMVLPISGKPCQVWALWEAGQLVHSHAHSYPSEMMETEASHEHLTGPGLSPGEAH